ncbi:uroporphyrinogen-III synthase [Lysobacter solisilvae (ex Woo and Kim 2022)]|uniref:Uroporphyrinogen-III synthase n=1 Tax=Agrilutibacter terrestris TaxID=2865112 RepID=A0A7H0G0U7_9GAMM|nr:uroporphyrinogen-III synthase [Lysobacter terrestris]QNP41913.1 uroporphyrinogen-III synthase [Lysobacter terrestris]
MNRSATPSWYVISLRPRGEHDVLRRAAARYGAGLIALSPWKLVLKDGPATHADLRAALAAAVVVFTSPTAVHAARALQPFAPRPGQHWCAVGAGTAAALHDAGVGVGVGTVHAPTRMDSDGLLALPVLQDVRGREVGLVTAPGGRGEIAPALEARGARILRADVYGRELIPLDAAAVHQVQAADVPLALALSSGEALQRVLDAIPAGAAAKLRNAHVVAASERLCVLARSLGFGDVSAASGPRPDDLLAAAARRHPVA